MENPEIVLTWRFPKQYKVLLFQVLRDLISEIPDGSQQKKSVIDCVVIKDPKTDLAPLARTESRVFLLYCTRKEAIAIMAEAERLGLTRKTYVWIAAQAVIGAGLDGPDEFPVGMLGVHFRTGIKVFLKIPLLTKKKGLFLI